MGLMQTIQLDFIGSPKLEIVEDEQFNLWDDKGKPTKIGNQIDFAKVDELFNSFDSVIICVFVVELIMPDSLPSWHKRGYIDSSEKICCDQCSLEYSAEHYKILYENKKLGYFLYPHPEDAPAIDLLCHDCLFKNLKKYAKGKVVDLESQFPLPGVNVQFVNGDFSSCVMFNHLTDFTFRADNSCTDSSLLV